MVPPTTQPIFLDTTLRDGEQASGVAFTLEEKLQLISLLSEMGIEEFEIGTPAMGAAAMEEMQAMTSLGLKGRMLAWCRAIPSEIELAKKCGINGIHLSFPVSDKLLDTMGKSREWVLSETERIIGLAYESFDFVSIGAQDASRADRDFLSHFVEQVVKNGAKRIRLADTVGTLNPFTTDSLVRAVRSIDSNISIEFHAHNDLGMACANTLAAWVAGADCLSTTVNGLGERAGNAAIEEVVMAIEKSMGFKTTIIKSRFPEICHYVEMISGRKNSLAKPVVGDLALTHESDIHTKCLMKDRSTYQLISAEDIGLTETTFRIGKHTGVSTLSYFLKDKDIVCDSEVLQMLLSRVREWCTIHKRDIQPNELLDMYKELYKTISVP